MFIDQKSFHADRVTEIATPVHFRPAAEGGAATRSLMNNPLFVLAATPLLVVAWAGMAVWMIGGAAGTMLLRRGG